MKELNRDFFERDTLSVAQELLGKVISVNGFLGKIVEVEAYGQDPASHAFKKTERSKLMFDTFGYIYIYLIYGMYNCINFTTEKEGKPGAVLIRAIEPLNKIDKLQKIRKTNKLTKLCSGPGKLCQALKIDKSLNGAKLGKGVKIYDDGSKVGSIGSSSRIGIKDALNLKWRFYIKENKFVSNVKFDK
ncbi:MAG: DNA-3-methyladenine glycosylase [Candidatus Cloacimonetes bacterium]|nr:DNA-3-methyladenine glycosylase [Candidatus Cloacimonadota bacterium]